MKIAVRLEGLGHRTSFLYRQKPACALVGLYILHTCTCTCMSSMQEQKRQEAYEEFLKEKLMIDEIVRKIYEEDQRWVLNSLAS